MYNQNPKFLSTSTAIKQLDKLNLPLRQRKFNCYNLAFWGLKKITNKAQRLRATFVSRKKKKKNEKNDLWKIHFLERKSETENNWSIDAGEIFCFSIFMLLNFPNSQHDFVA